MLEDLLSYHKICITIIHGELTSLEDRFNVFGFFFFFSFPIIAWGILISNFTKTFHSIDTLLGITRTSQEHCPYQPCLNRIKHTHARTHTRTHPYQEQHKGYTY